jgi:hypothetical protein
MIIDLAPLNEKGYVIAPSVFEPDYMDEISAAIGESYKLCREIQFKNGITAATDGTVHHLLATENDIYLDLLSKICSSDVYDFIKMYFDGNFILNSYGGLKNLPGKPSYVAKVHRDIRFFSGSFPLMLNMLIMLDDFTLENGATFLLTGSHLSDIKPSDEEFYEKSSRAVGKKGDILFFNSNLWHAAGANETTKERNAITITFTKPFMKQQLDYPRAIGFKKMEQLTPALQQLIGFYSRTPTNLNEWYQKPENRFYRPGQD